METHPFDGVYNLEMVVEKKVCKKRKRKGKNVNHHRIEILNLEYVDILVYEYQLTKKGTLRSKTTKIIEKLLPQEIVASLESAKPRHRSRRNMSYEILGILKTRAGIILGANFSPVGCFSMFFSQKRFTILHFLKPYFTQF